jgi:flagellar motor switch protein FliG
MTKLRTSILFAFIAMAFWPVPARTADDAPDPMVLDQERKLKEDAETKAQAICDSIMGKDMSNVLVNVELGIESTRKGGANLNQKRDSKSELGADSFLLPWVPAPKSVTKEEVPKDASLATQAAQQNSVDVRTVVKRFDITVIHDKNIPEETVASAKDALETTFDRFKNVLKLYFKASSFVRKDFDPKATVTKNFWDSLTFKNFLLLFFLFLLLPILKFLKAVASFLQNYLEGMKEASKSRVEMENKSQSENDTEQDAEGEQPAEMTPEELALLEAEEEAMKKLVPFTYINETNLKQLAYLLHHEEPWIVALVISYLTPEFAFKVMESLPADLQAKVALETAMYRQTSEEQVIAINEDIKQKIDFVVGGLDKLVGILENSDRMAQDNILEYLKNEKPAIYERVREQILMFEDIANFPKMAMQVVVRELKTEELARALRGAGPELQQKFYDNMSQGAVTLLKEEMEFGRPVTDDQINEERKKIVDFIKTMEKEGKVSFRQKGKSALNPEDLGEGMAQLQSRMKGRSGSPEEALNAYNAGVAASEGGRLEEAVQYFETSVQMDPSSSASLQGLANAYYALGRYQEAVATYDQLLQLEPNGELQAVGEDPETGRSHGARLGENPERGRRAISKRSPRH